MRLFGAPSSAKVFGTVGRLLTIPFVLGVFVALMFVASRPATTAHACSAAFAFDYVARDIDAAAIVYVESVQGPENREPLVTSVTPPHPTSGRSAPIDLEGYGAFVRLHTPIIGTLPDAFDLDTEVRQRMERSIRQIEGGYVAPCAPNFLVAHYIPGQDYLVLLHQTDAGWQTYATFNYRVEGADLLTAKVLPEEQRVTSGPWPVEVSRDVYQRYFPGLGERTYPGSDTHEVVALKDEIWQVKAPRVSADAFIAALLSARTRPMIVPPDTGDAGLHTLTYD
jgi:hypothetical protein